jgi:biopolymer transport protein ExbD
VTLPELQQKLTQISQVYPDQAVVLRGAGPATYKSVIDVLDVCAAARLTNIAFATNKANPNGS